MLGIERAALATAPEAAGSSEAARAARADVVLRLGAGASLVVAGALLGPAPVLLVVGVVVLVSARLAPGRRMTPGTGRTAPRADGAVGVPRPGIEGVDADHLPMSGSMR